MAQAIKNQSYSYGDEKEESSTNLESKKEGSLTKMIEEQTAKVPSGLFLVLGAGAVMLSLGVEIFTGKKAIGSFIATWVPTILLLGVYNKLVKLHGSELDGQAA